MSGGGQLFFAVSNRSEVDETNKVEKKMVF